MKVGRDELMVLLNNLYEKNPDFEIKTKLKIDEKDSSLASVDLKDDRAKVTVMDENKYSELTFEHEEILPDYSNYVTSLVSAGVLKLEEWDKQYNKIANEFKKSIYERQRPLYVSFDTNCFINRISYQLDRYVKQGVFVVADGVRKELFKEVAGKYSEYELRRLTQKDGRFKQFLNQPKVRERIKKIGKAEYDRFKKNVTLEEIPSGTGDNEIAEALGNFARARNCDVWLITLDKTMYEIAAGFGVKPILFEFPKVHERKIRTDWENVCDLIYTMAVIFGFINISGIHVFGIWKGKNPDDWNEERVLITDGNKKIFEKIEKDFVVLRALNEISSNTN